MKTSYFNYLLLLGVLLTACGPEPAAPEEEIYADVTVDESLAKTTMENIKEEYLAVEKLISDARLKVDSMAYECPDDPEGGHLKFYRTDGEIRLIKHDYYQGDHSGGVANYYLKDDQLFFAFIEDGYWTFDTDFPGEPDPENPPTKDVITEYRYYFDEAGEALQCLQKEYVIRSADGQETNPGLISNKEVSCAEAAIVKAQFEQLFRMEILEDAKREICL